MNGFGKHIKPFVDAELRRAWEAHAQGNGQTAFGHLERAHVLGQASTVQHVRVHAHMLAWGLHHHRRREVWGQLMRIFGAATKTVFWIPVGNTGGSNVSPFKPMPIPEDLQQLIARAKGAADPR
jgi:hypothetical protein